MFSYPGCHFHLAFQEKEIPMEKEECKIWIGNLDKHVTEYQLLHILKKFGEIKDFQFLFHMHGPLKKQPRGYCFVRYETEEESSKAIAALNGRQLLSKNIVVDYAKKQSNPEDNGFASKKDMEVEKANKKISKDKQIKAIEAKLLKMESGIEETIQNTKIDKFRTEKKLIRKRSHPYSQHRKRSIKK